MTAVFARLRTVWSSRHRRTRYACAAIVGYEPCCCGEPECFSSWPIRCAARVSRLRWVLVGRCGQCGGER